MDLYVGKDVIKRAIPNELACDALVQLIKDNNRWVEPPAPEDMSVSAKELASA